MSVFYQPATWRHRQLYIMNSYCKSHQSHSFGCHKNWKSCTWIKDLLSNCKSVSPWKTWTVLSSGNTVRMYSDVPGVNHSPPGPLADQLPSVQATATAADTSPVCPQAPENQSSRSLRCHRRPSTRRSAQTVFPQNPAARQWHSQPHFIRGVGPQRAPQGLFRTCNTLCQTEVVLIHLFCNECSFLLLFFLFVENSEHSGCWNDANGGDGCIRCTCSSGENYPTE